MELNGYRIMWLFVFFDLPTDTKKDKKNASGFRNNLLKDGFAMMQYSVYVRHCASGESADVHEKRIHKLLPPLGKACLPTVLNAVASLLGPVVLMPPWRDLPP